MSEFHLQESLKVRPSIRTELLKDSRGPLITRIGVSFKGSFKGVYRVSIVGFYNIGALIIRMGFPLKGSM